MCGGLCFIDKLQFNRKRDEVKAFQMRNIPQSSQMFENNRGYVDAET